MSAGLVTAATNKKSVPQAKRRYSVDVGGRGGQELGSHVDKRAVNPPYST